MKKKSLKNFVDKHWIAGWVVLSLLFALVIHLLFSLEAPTQYLIAHWSAGDILVYASTVALGLLALWQNRKQKEENDKAQERLENISIRANELNVINKIVEYESNRIRSLQIVMDTFTNACCPQSIALAAAKDGIAQTLSITGLTELEKTIDTSFFEIGRLLRNDNELKHNDKHPLNQAYGKLYSYAKIYISKLRDGTIDYGNSKVTQKIATDLADLRDSFLSEREKYLIIQENYLTKLLFEDLSLKEIRDLYYIKQL